MKKYIDAEGVMRACYDGFLKTGNKAYREIFALVETVPAEDVQEVKHGHWKGINRNKYNDDEATCSVCGVTFSSGYSDPSWWDYCPNCGAKMDEVKE